MVYGGFTACPFMNMLQCMQYASLGFVVHAACHAGCIMSCKRQPPIIHITIHTKTVANVFESTFKGGWWH